MSKEPIIVVHGNAAQGESRFVDLSGHDVFVASVDDLMNAPEDVAAAYREFVETRGTTLSDLRLGDVIEDRSGSIPQDMIEAMHAEVVRIQHETPLVTIVFDDKINSMIMAPSSPLPRKEKDWQQNQKRGRMKPRRR